MSFRVRDIQSILNNPLNHSVSKQQYSIPKAQRFKYTKLELVYKYYDLPSTNSKKSPSFGISVRPALFVGDKNIPSPNKYTIKDMMDQKKFISFSKGREECKSSNFLRTNDNPGPGAYNPNPEFVESSVSKKYSMRSKTQQGHRQPNQVPGPGKYNIKQAWLEKDKILSTDRKYPSPLIRPEKEKKDKVFNIINVDVPYYNPTKTYTGRETFNKTGGFSLGKSRRFSQRIKTQGPGPGRQQNMLLTQSNIF